MEFKRPRRSHVMVNTLAETYPFHLQLYRDPPENEITLNQFEEYAIERLKGIGCESRTVS